MTQPPTLRWIPLLLLLSACTLPLPATVGPAPSPSMAEPPLSEAPPPTISLAETATLASLSGRVDMASAPPYLNDPIVTGGLGVPVVVVAFNLDVGSWYWVDTTPTHPSYQLSVPAGRYYLVAYGQGLPSLPDLPYVAGGYTGMNPSCGQLLLDVVVAAGEVRTGLDIADWNWSCGGTAYRPEKPDEVPIP
ncbi:MAG: hypothetical protein AB1449_07060 [Chloroflexota bacterium]